MNVKQCLNREDLGEEAAIVAAEVINNTIQKKDKARIVLSTGASQFEFIQAILNKVVDWSKVEMFHLDEYVNLPESHPASFRKYLKERFVSHINLKAAHYVNGEGEIERHIQQLTENIRKEPIDLAVIGIGENAHIAFNDPPADFDTEEAFMVVQLDEACKKQQVREGWFATIEDVPKQAITMTVHQIMQSEVIISCVPGKEKANAVKLLLENEITNEIPATILKQHPNWTLFLDKDSSS